MRLSEQLGFRLTPVIGLVLVSLLFFLVTYFVDAAKANLALLPIDVSSRPWTILTGMAYLPATVPPIGLGSSGSPIGIQVVGPYGSDYRTIRLAAHLSEICGGYQPPPIALTV